MLECQSCLFVNYATVQLIKTQERLHFSLSLTHGRSDLQKVAHEVYDSHGFVDVWIDIHSTNDPKSEITCKD